MPSPQIERKLAAIMFTDIAGYTALSAKDSTKASELLTTQRDTLKPIVEKHGGSWMKEIGDGLLLIFDSATSAVECSIAIQESTKDIEDLNLRIGIHEGEVIKQDGDVIGDDVNVASRIEPFSAVGGVAISQKIQQAISSNTEFETKYVGKPKLKGVAQEVKVYCITSHGLPETNISQVSAKLENQLNKHQNRKRLIGLVLGLFLMLFLYNMITQGQNKVIIGIIYDDGKFISYKNELINRNREDTVKIISIPDSLAETINQTLYYNLLDEFMGVEIKILNNENLENLYSMSLNDSINKYFDANHENFGLDSFVMRLFKIIKSDLIIYWIVSDSKKNYHIYKMYYERGRLLFTNGNSFIEKYDLIEQINELQSQDIDMLTRNKGFNLVDYIINLYSEIIAGRANWAGKGYIDEIFEDKYKIKLLNPYNIKKDMELSVQKVFALNNPYERKRYINFLNHNISYLDSLKNLEPDIWNNIYRSYKNLLDDYNEDKYIDIGNQFLSYPPCGKIILKIDGVIDDYAIATLRYKEFSWITIDKEDKIDY